MVWKIRVYLAIAALWVFIKVAPRELFFRIEISRSATPPQNEGE
jgi:hypothetical protein